MFTCLHCYPIFCIELLNDIIHTLYEFLLFTYNFLCLYIVVCRCDICVNGPPKMQNLKEAADIFMSVLKAECVSLIAFTDAKCGLVI